MYKILTKPLSPVKPLSLNVFHPADGENQNGGKEDERSIKGNRGPAGGICNVIYHRIWSVTMLSAAASKWAVAILLTMTTTAWYPGGGEFKCYMDYRAITSTGSPQYQLQQEAYTDENGIRKVGGFYCVALGSAFGSEIGTRYIITLSSGNQVPVILADQKANKHTTADNTRDYSGAVIEFVVDTPVLPYEVKHSGSVGSIPEFAGEVVEIRRLNNAGM